MTGHTRPLVGLWCKSPDPGLAELVASTGVDYLIADQQHGQIDSGALLHLAHAAAVSGVALMTRVHRDDAPAVQRAIDLGVDAVIVPGLEDAGSVAGMAKLFDHPPVGERSHGTTRSSLASGRAAGTVRARTRFMIMVETVQAVRGIEALVATPGLDGVYVGPVDLALSMGLGAARSPSVPEHREAVTEVLRHARAASRTVGTGATDVEDLRRCVADGFDLVTVGSDWGLVESGVRARLATLAAASPAGVGR